MRTLRKALKDYLVERRGNGRKMRGAGFALSRFVTFMEERKCSYVTTALAVEWVPQASSAKFQEGARAQYMSFVRAFAKYLTAHDARTEVPPYGVMPYPPKRAEPKILREPETNELVPTKASHEQTLREAIKDYLAMRRALGFKLRVAGAGLLDFASFMEERGATYITVTLALEWAQQPTTAEPATWAQHLGFVREFARHRIATDPRTEIPSWNLLPHSKKRTRPYLYSNEEIRSLLQATKNLPIYNSAGVLRRQSYYCLLGLLAVTGMRISEAVNLKLCDVDFKTGVLTVRGSKFGKSRLIPVHQTTLDVLSEYKEFRDEYLSKRAFPSDSFFVTHRGGKLNTGDIRRKFYSLSRAVGLRGDGRNVGPRIHDLRHRFAIETLLRWYRNDEDVERNLPLLSTYLGHVKVKDTYWYLTASPELMGVAVRLLEQRWEEAR